MVRIAVQGIGPGTTTEQIKDYLWTHFAHAVDSRYVPIYLASLRGEDLLKQARLLAAEIVREAELEPKPKKKKR